MADLSGMFQNLGPTSGALMSGLQTGQDIVSAAQQDDLRKAQMDEILQRAAAAKEMAPLELQAKQQSIAAADLKAKQEKEAYRDEILSKAIPQLKSVKGPQRMAEYERIFQEAGLPLDEADRKLMYSKDPDKLLADLEARHKWSIEQNAQYRREMDKQALHNKGMLDIENARETARNKAAQEKATAEKTLQQDLSGAKNYQAQAVVYSNHAAKARLKGDAEEAARLEGLAKQATAQDLSARAAAGDAQAANQLRLLQGFGVQMQTPPSAPNAAPAAPALPTGWSIKQ
jgi:hypothetical protein